MSKRKILSPILSLDYKPTKTAEAFHHDNSRVKGLLGPIGCGKSAACAQEIIKCAILQPPGIDGVRRSRWAIIRNTYPELKSTTIKTWINWFPEQLYGKIKYDSPINQTIHIIRDDDDTLVYIEILFLALNSPDDRQKLRSLELTGAYINELQFIDELIFTDSLTRINRYPAKKDGRNRWVGILWDANPPSTMHWMYDAFERSMPKDYKVFRYEPAMLRVDVAPDHGHVAISKDGTLYINNPKADYISIQADPDYWFNLIPSLRDEKIKVDILGEYGVVVSGRAVHESYNDKLHHSPRRLTYDSSIELGLGFDFGLTPACAIVQLAANGRFLVLDELWSTHMGLRDFLKNVVIPHLDKKFEGWRQNYYSAHDPAGDTGSQTDGKSCKLILKEEGIISHPAAGNNSPTARRDAVKFFLGRMSDGQPSFLLSHQIQLMREGLLGNFMYGRVQAGGEARYTEKPVKNIFSHICEALEYIAMRYCAETKKPESVKKPNRKAKRSFLAR